MAGKYIRGHLAFASKTLRARVPQGSRALLALVAVCVLAFAQAAGLGLAGLGPLPDLTASRLRLTRTMLSTAKLPLSSVWLHFTP